MFSHQRGLLEPSRLLHLLCGLSSAPPSPRQSPPFHFKGSDVFETLPETARPLCGRLEVGRIDFCILPGALGKVQKKCGIDFFFSAHFQERAPPARRRARGPRSNQTNGGRGRARLGPGARIDHRVMSLVQLVYASQPFGFDDPMLNGILSDARRCNERDNITGALVCRADLYLQYLEGAETAVEAAFKRIALDDRHLEVTRLVYAPITARLFPKWAMLDDPARSWMWTQAEVADGAVTRASAAEIIGVFARIAKEVI